MMYEILKKELANYILQEMYHKSEQEKGFDLEYHEKAERDANICWNATRRIIEMLLGKEIFFKISFEARQMAKEKFEKGIICIY